MRTVGLSVFSLLFGLALVVPSQVQPEAADLPTAAAPSASLSEAGAVEDYVNRRADLHILRAVFDVIAPDQIPELLRQDVMTARDGVTTAQFDKVSYDLISEGSYFVVSLIYLIEAGFPNWPGDKPDETYRFDALERLERHRVDLIRTVLDGGDPLAILESIAEVYWWTEGAKEPVNGRGDFGDRQRLVDEAMIAGAKAPRVGV